MYFYMEGILSTIDDKRLIIKAYNYVIKQNTCFIINVTSVKKKGTSF